MKAAGKKEKVIHKYIIAAILPALFFGIMIPAGRALKNDNDLSSILHGDRGLFNDLILPAAGYGLIFFAVFLILFFLMDILSDKGIYIKDGSSRLSEFFLKKWWVIFVILSVLAILIFIPLYPGIPMGDTSSQISEIFGRKAIYAYREMEYLYPGSTLTNMHPLLSTLLLKACMLAGFHITGSYNAGLALMVLIQIFFASFVLARSLNILARLRVRSILILICLAVTALNPVIIDYLYVITKDTIYGAALLLFVSEMSILVRGIYNRSDIWLFCVSAVLTAAFRGEGLYVVIISLLAAGIRTIVKRKKVCGMFALMMVSLIAVHIIWVNAVFPLLSVTPAAKSHQLTIPMQQVARYVLLHEDELTEEELSKVTDVISIDDIKDGYDPEDADYIKMRFDINASDEQLKGFMKVWLDMGVKDPASHFEAWLLTKYEYFYMENVAIRLYRTATGQVQMDNLNRGALNSGQELNLHYPSSGSGMREALESFAMGLRKTKAVRLIFRPAVYLLLMIALTAFFIIKKMRTGMVLMVPSIFIYLVIDMLSATNGHYGRYIYPIIIMIPFIFPAGIAREQTN